MACEKVKYVPDDEVYKISEQLIERNLKAYTELANDVANTDEDDNSSEK